MKVHRTLIAMIALAVAAPPAFAHHSQLEFAGGTKMTLHGVVTKVEWVNPHAYCFVDAKDPASGKLINWEIEMGSPAAIARRGIRKDTLKVGIMVTIIGQRASDKSYRMAPDKFVFGRQ